MGGVPRLGGYFFFGEELVQSVEGVSGGFFANHEHFGGDAEGDFVGRLGTKVKADGGVDLGEL